MTTNISWSLLHMKLKNGIINGAVILGIGAFIAKFLGALYRIPLTNRLGGYGLGLYQMVFPVYTLLLDFSGAGVPNALSRIISKEKSELVAKRMLKNSVKLFAIFGLIATLFMAVFCSTLARFQGNVEARTAYLCLAPAIFFVSIISCFRGYFQGNMNMRPTAISQILEQVFKLLLGVFFINLFYPNVPLCVSGATLAITFSEIIALLYLVVSYKFYNKKNKLEVQTAGNFISDAKVIIKTTIPITLVGIIIPFSQVVDSFLTINILSRYLKNATVLFGLLSGVVMTVINLPVSVCYGLSTVAVPTVSSCESQLEIDKNSKKILSLTFLITLPCVLFLLLFSPFTINLLFSGLPIGEKQIAVNLLRLCSPIVILLSVVQASNAVLIGKGKLYTPVLTLTFGVIVKVILNLVLLNKRELNIYGGAIAIIACYFSVCLINLILIFRKRVKNESRKNFSSKFIYQK